MTKCSMQQPLPYPPKPPPNPPNPPPKPPPVELEVKQDIYDTIKWFYSEASNISTPHILLSAVRDFRRISYHSLHIHSLHSVFLQPPLNSLVLLFWKRNRSLAVMIWYLLLMQRMRKPWRWRIKQLKFCVETLPFYRILDWLTRIICSEWYWLTRCVIANDIWVDREAEFLYQKLLWLSDQRQVGGSAIDCVGD